MVQLVRDHYQALLKGVTPTAVAVEGVAGDTTLGLRRKQGSSFELTHNQTTLHLSATIINGPSFNLIYQFKHFIIV